MPMDAEIPIDHHFVPIFYQKAWAGLDERVIRYSRPFDKVVAKPCAPSRTGSAKNLYDLQGLSPERRAVLETEFFKPIDNKAAIAFQLLRAGRLNDLTGDQRCDIARFMLSMISRNPFGLAELERLVDQIVRANLDVDDAEYSAIRRPGDPATLYDWTIQHQPHVIAEAHKRWLPSAIDHGDLGQHMINMVWATLDVSDAKHTLLTSDRPFSWTAGWKEPRALLAFPLAPELLFLATNSREVMDQVLRNPPDRVVRQANEDVVRLAVDFVIGRDNSHLSFVEKRLRRPDEPPIPGPIGRGRPNCPA
jgi:hypothetical protein